MNILSRLLPVLSPRAIWLVLVLATGLTFVAGDFGDFSGPSGRLLILGVLALASLKAGLVALDFMELRHAPALWRRLVLGWLLVVITGIVFAYLQ